MVSNYANNEFTMPGAVPQAQLVLKFLMQVSSYFVTAVVASAAQVLVASSGPDSAGVQAI